MRADQIADLVIMLVIQGGLSRGMWLPDGVGVSHVRP